MRAITALVRSTKFNPKNGKLTTKYENINVLVGPTASVDCLKQKVDELLGKINGQYETEDRI